MLVKACLFSKSFQRNQQTNNLQQIIKLCEYYLIDTYKIGK